MQKNIAIYLEDFITKYVANIKKRLFLLNTPNIFIKNQYLVRLNAGKLVNKKIELVKTLGKRWDIKNPHSEGY